jgi:hypothetical protein
MLRISKKRGPWETGIQVEGRDLLVTVGPEGLAFKLKGLRSGDRSIAWAEVWAVAGGKLLTHLHDQAAPAAPARTKVTAWSVDVPTQTTFETHSAALKEWAGMVLDGFSDNTLRSAVVAGCRELLRQCSTLRLDSPGRAKIQETAQELIDDINDMEQGDPAHDFYKNAERRVRILAERNG